jgi:hypothetical protein
MEKLKQIFFLKYKALWMHNIKNVTVLGEKAVVT